MKGNLLCYIHKLIYVSRLNVNSLMTSFKEERTDCVENCVAIIAYNYTPVFYILTVLLYVNKAEELNHFTEQFYIDTKYQFITRKMP